MNLNDFTQYFDNPAVSVFDRSKSVSFPVKIGALYPAKWELLSFGNSQKSNSAHSMRLAPLVAPSYTDLQFQNISAIVPLRTIMKNYEERFNYATNRDGSSLPHFTLKTYKSVISKMLRIGVSPIGSLFDFLGYPVFADLYKSLDFSMFNTTYQSKTFNAFDLVPYSVVYTSLIESTYSSYFELAYRDNFTEVNLFFSFIIWIVIQTYNEDPNQGVVVIGNRVRDFYASIPNALNEDGSIKFGYTPSLDEVIKASSFSTTKDAIDAYKNYLFGICLESYLDEAHLDEAENVTYSLLPLMAFWRFHYDWNVNGNFIDRDVMLEDDVYTLATTLYVLNINDESEREHFKRLVTVPNRLWNDDFWTSLLPTSTVDNAVEIPANSTVLDLAKLTAWQKFVMRLSYSSRYRDVVWNIFKIKPSDARLVQSYPIFRSYDNVGIGEVNQTSSTDVSGVLGGFAGRGYSSGRNKGYSIFCEEPCIIFDFVSLMPKAKYADAVHPLIHVDDILDFPLPDMDVLGNQPIYSDLISGNPADADIVLGYGRQYQEWLSNYGTVHGDFKTTLDYWTIARRFSDTPVINDDFLRIHPADDLDIIFSLQGENHAFLDIYYNAKVTRHVHRNVRIKI